MSKVHDVPVLPFRHDTDEESLRDPFGRWDRLRNAHPIFKSDQADHGVIFLMGYAEQHAALRDPKIFSNRSVNPEFRTESPVGVEGPFEGDFKLIPVQLDPPEHTKYRQLLNPLMTPGRVNALEPRARALAGSLIDGFIDDGSVEYVTKFARRFPTTIFMQMMGLPVENADMFLAWIDALMHSSSDLALSEQERVTNSRNAATSIFEYLGQLITERRADPKDDFVSYLLTCRVDDRPVNEQELMQMCFMLYMAGLDTVAGALGYFMYHLATHDADRQRLVKDPTVVPGAVEELLRFYSVVTTVREVTQDGEFLGCPMHEGDRVIFPTASANRDPNEFENAETFDMDRSPNRHMAFGAGPHRCLGSHLARMELRVALEEWHARIPVYSTPDPGALRNHVLSVSGLVSLPLVFDRPTSRVSSPNDDPPETH
jgi:cytochrome P450